MTLHVRVVDHDDGAKDFIRMSDGMILLQTTSGEDGKLYVGFVDRTLLPGWPEVPNWYPVERAIHLTILRHYED